MPFFGNFLTKLQKKVIFDFVLINQFQFLKQKQYTFSKRQIKYITLIFAYCNFINKFLQFQIYKSNFNNQKQNLYLFVSKLLRKPLYQFQRFLLLRIQNLHKDKPQYQKFSQFFRILIIKIMLQSSFKNISQHFKPESQFNKNIFLLKQYDYPQYFQQRLYVSYLEIQDLLKTKTSQQIIKKITVVSAKSDKNMEKVIFGFVYAIMLYSSKQKSSNSSSISEKITQNDNFYTFQSQQNPLITQIKSYFNIFRSQAWSLFNNVTLELMSNYFSQIKPQFRLGFIEIFRYLQKYSLCSDDLFITAMKTLCFYDQKNISIKYNIELMKELSTIIQIYKNTNFSSNANLQLDQKLSFSKAKLQQQVSLMRHYLFGKMLHWQFLIYRLKSYRTNDWPLNLERLNNASFSMLKLLYSSNNEQCLVFSSQLCRYAEFITPDQEFNHMLKRIVQKSSKSLDSQYISHHYQLVSIAIQFLFPLKIEKTITQAYRTLYTLQNQQQPQYIRAQKGNVMYILQWMWRQCNKNFSQQNNKNYLLENTFSDIIRWSLMSFEKNLELRSFVIQWILYKSSQNEMIYRLVKQAFFCDWIYYLKIAQQMNFQSFFAILTPSLHIINSFAFYCPSLAEDLLVYLLGKNIQLKCSYQSGNISQGLFRTYINEILKKASDQGILRIPEIVNQSQLNNYVKHQLQQRVYQAQMNSLSIQNNHTKNLSYNEQKMMIKPSQINNNELYSNKQSQKIDISKNSKLSYDDVSIEESQYYGQKKLDINFDLKYQDIESQHFNEDQEDLIYSSHQFIPSSPSYQGNQDEPHYEIIKKENQLEIPFNIQKNQKRESFKRQSNIPIYDLQKQVSSSEQGNSKRSQSHKKINSSNEPISNLTQSQLLQSTFKVSIEKQYIEQMGDEIEQLVKNPNIVQFTQFIKHLIKILKQYKKSQEEEMIERFFQQTTKILYIIFNKQFQSFDFKDTLYENQQIKGDKCQKYLTYFLMKSIHQHWKQSLTLFNIYVYKKIVKNLCQSFQSCQFTFYYVLLDIFKKGVPNYKEMKLWLFDKEKQKFIIPVLQRILGKKFRLQLYENAQMLKIQ